MKFVMYPHGGSGNHGCEAIVRCTKKLTGAELLLYSSAVEEDRKYGLDEVCTLDFSEKQISHVSASYLMAKFRNAVLHDSGAFDELVFKHIVDESAKADAFLSIGGDNYCYSMPGYILLINRMLDRKGVRRVLWGASVEPDSMNGRLLDDLRGYTRIWARESLTYDAMLSKGLTQTVLMPDPAFVLDKKEKALPETFIEGNTVGINVSPMVCGSENVEGVTMANYICLVDYILSSTDMNIALIPHVVWSHNDDRKPLTLLYDKYKDSGRVCMISDCSCEELKGYIARCRFMIAARTHASIASYSSCVSTLVVGYSVKARGIAKDLFGTDENYVVPVQSLKNEKELVKSFLWLQENEKMVKNHLQSFMPEYVSRLEGVNDLLNN